MTEISRKYKINALSADAHDLALLRKAIKKATKYKQCDDIIRYKSALAYFIYITWMSGIYKLNEYGLNIAYHY